MQNKKSVYQLLLDLAQRIGPKARLEHLFDPFVELLGFRIAWLRPHIVDQLCEEYGFDAAKCEIVIMQATGQTECHMHEIGESTFLTLGEETGFKNPVGGTLFGDFDPKQAEFELEPTEAAPGKFFTVGAKKIHAFYSDGDSAPLTAIGFVTPRIRKATVFDVVPFRFITDSAPFKVELAT